MPKKGSVVQTRDLFALLFEHRDTDVLSFAGGKFSDKFVPPNKILRKGTFEIDGSSEYAAIRFEAVITLGALVPKEKTT